MFYQNHILMGTEKQTEPPFKFEILSSLPSKERSKQSKLSDLSVFQDYEALKLAYSTEIWAWMYDGNINTFWLSV